MRRLIGSAVLVAALVLAGASTSIAQGARGAANESDVVPASFTVGVLLGLSLWH